MTMKLLALASLLVLAGCDDFRPSPQYEPDQSKRQTYFLECMKALPAGPIATRYNDWDEVVSECRSTAYYNSLMCVANCRALQAKEAQP